MTLLLTVIGISLAISFLCSILEAVLLSISHSYVAVLQERGHRAGNLLARMRANIDEPIAAILTLNTIAHTVGAAMGGAIALEVFGDRWIALFSAVLTLAILIFSEIVPKTIGASFWQVLAPFAAETLRWLILGMKPILIPLSALNRVLTPRRKRASTVSRAELEILAEIGRREGEIDQAEWEVVTNVMRFDDVLVGHVMTPRTEVIAVPSESTLKHAQDVMLESGHFRLPAYETSIDRIVGVVLARDLWRAAAAGHADLGDVMRPATFVPETKPAEDMIREMRQKKIKMAIVLDEYGGTAGLVTLEDLIEEIVGEIQDEHEQEPLEFEDFAGGEVGIAGKAPVAEVNERVDLELPEELYSTVGGFIFGTLGRVPQEGDEVPVRNGVLRVTKMDGRRVERVSFLSRRKVAGAKPGNGARGRVDHRDTNRNDRR
jgi:putative hemolysin